MIKPLKLRKQVKTRLNRDSRYLVTLCITVDIAPNIAQPTRTQVIKVSDNAPLCVLIACSMVVATAMCSVIRSDCGKAGKVGRPLVCAEQSLPEPRSPKKDAVSYSHRQG